VALSPPSDDDRLRDAAEGAHPPRGPPRDVSRVPAANGIRCEDELDPVRADDLAVVGRGECVGTVGLARLGHAVRVCVPAAPEIDVASPGAPQGRLVLVRLPDRDPCCVWKTPWLPVGSRPAPSVISMTPSRRRPKRLPPVSTQSSRPSLRSSSALIPRRALGSSLTVSAGALSLRAREHPAWRVALARERSAFRWRARRKTERRPPRPRSRRGTTI
jgi:hypothetical protein